MIAIQYYLSPANTKKIEPIVFGRANTEKNVLISPIKSEGGGVFCSKETAECFKNITFGGNIDRFGKNRLNFTLLRQASASEVKEVFKKSLTQTMKEVKGVKNLCYKPNGVFDPHKLFKVSDFEQKCEALRGRALETEKVLEILLSRDPALQKSFEPVRNSFAALSSSIQFHTDDGKACSGCLNSLVEEGRGLAQLSRDMNHPAFSRTSALYKEQADSLRSARGNDTASYDIVHQASSRAHQMALPYLKDNTPDSLYSIALDLDDSARHLEENAFQVLLHPSGLVNRYERVLGAIGNHLSR